MVTSEEHEAKIRALEEQLAAAHEETERAKAMAEHTKSGSFYIISNIGSFGEDVVKIGLTRRLDPMDRVSAPSGSYDLADAANVFYDGPHRSDTSSPAKYSIVFLPCSQISCDPIGSSTSVRCQPNYACYGPEADLFA